jgi:hypothetical protein
MTIRDPAKAADRDSDLQASRSVTRPSVVSTQWVVKHVQEDWSYPSYFEPFSASDLPDAVIRANEYQEAASIQDHRFFQIALVSRDALRLWASQEAVITGPFSQLLLLVAARIDNVHLRAGLVEVIRGEHNNPGNQVARHSHPWLLHKLCTSLGLGASDVRPLPATLRFLQVLSDTTDTLLSALGALGVGNERILIPEYSAVRSCFNACYPEADYKGFLEANISEDTEHSAIIQRIASALITSGANPQNYVDGAKQAVDARVAYYDELVSIISRSPTRSD